MLIPLFNKFKRGFGFWSTFGFTSLYIATWEYLLVSVYSGLVNGGFGGLVYEYIGTSICYFSVVLSLAEMASMAVSQAVPASNRALILKQSKPTAGGQYHWVSEFAPPRMQRYLSYAAGWTSATGWLVGAAGSAFIMQTLLESIIEVYNPDFTFNNWQVTLVMMAFVLITVIFNTLGTRLLPIIETVSLVGHIAGWIITTAALWALAPRNSAHDVFVSVVNSGGWSNTGLSCLVGSISIPYCQLGESECPETPLSAPLVAADVLYRPRCSCSHIGGSQRCLFRAAKMHRLGLPLQRRPGLDHPHHDAVHGWKPR